MSGKVTLRSLSAVIIAAVGVAVLILRVESPIHSGRGDLVQYMARREGIPDAVVERKWRRVMVGSGSVVEVVGLGCHFLTSDGELLPYSGSELRLLGAGESGEPHFEDADIIMLKRHWHYIVLSDASRRCLMAIWKGEADTAPGAVADEIVEAERQRLVRLIGDQSLSWSFLRSLAGMLMDVASRLNAGAAVMERLAGVMGQLAKCDEWADRARKEANAVRRRAMSEIESQYQLGTDGRPLPGRYCADYIGFGRKELAAIAEYWDSELWTRVIVNKEDSLVAVPLGRRIQAVAESLSGIRQCSKMQFLEWAERP